MSFASTRGIPITGGSQGAETLINPDFTKVTERDNYTGVLTQCKINDTYTADILVSADTTTNTPIIAIGCANINNLKQTSLILTEKNVNLQAPETGGGSVATAILMGDPNGIRITSADTISITSQGRGVGRDGGNISFLADNFVSTQDPKQVTNGSDQQVPTTSWVINLINAFATANSLTPISLPYPPNN